MVERDTVFQFQLVADHFKQAGGIISDRIGRSVARIRVRGRQGRDHRTRIVFINAVAGQHDLRRRLVDVSDGDPHGFIIGQAAAVGDAHGHAVCVLPLVIERGAVLQLQLVADHLEQAGRVVGDRISRSVSGVRI